MKTWIHLIAPAAALLLAAPATRAADDDKPQPKEKKPPLRVLAGPERDRRVFMRGNHEPMPKEPVTFLGVEATPAPPALASQLGLAPGTGLVVGHVAPKSPADGVFQQHDILLKLDDQILIEPHQFAVLIRNHKEGDEVTLTYLRGGKQATAKVKLATHEAPKLGQFDGGGPRTFNYAYAAGRDGRFEVQARRPDDLEPGEWDRVLSLLQRGPAVDAPPGAVPPGARIRIDHGDGPGFRAMSVNTGNSNLAYTDDEGSLDLTIEDGAKMLVAKDAKGEQVFSGPVTTAEDRKALPPAVRERLEKLEGMHDITFRTDGDFRPREMRVLPFPPKEISVPRTRRIEAPAPTTSRDFF